ncbi:protein L [Rhodoferax aquaticus]|uniref:Protein L n=1 Tax=Rhodoferax aquaticus TaxID=2527691 RepID=A0A515ET20_9BURK|nr:protein L [Rhodoferax aquaticus]
MAWYIDSNRVKKSAKPDLSHWTVTHSPGSVVPDSGIYVCLICGKEVTCNKSDSFPPQNHHQHYESKPPIRWKLLVKAVTD